MGIYVKQPLKLTHNSNMLCSSIKHDWCRYFHRGSGSCLGFLGNERGVIWSCKMIAFENGIAISHNFDRTEMESRGTNTFSEAACSGDVPFCPMKCFLGWTLTQVRSSSSTFYLLVYLFSCCTQEQVGDMINFCWHLLNSCHFFHCEIIEILKNSNKLETHALKKTWDAAALYHSF